ncbi:hypothetical protein [Streptomyces olivoreticuli]|uniref:hypothetical protein n=1 Tax=Streptomyces olivoreticuli TaxID=68246 RepID=UPI000E2575E2|nr:hypothetical protein [Streptomyces olivoreticuli]
MTAGTEFRDVVRPTDCLRPPGTPEEFTSPIDTLNAAGDLVSPSFWMSKVLDFALALDPLEEGRKYFAGDWEAYARSAEAWANLAGFCEGLATNIESGNHLLGGAWQGEAAAAADVYFASLCGKLRAIKGSLETMHKEYLVAAHGVSMTGEAVAQLMGLIGDAAATAAIAWAAGGLTAWTGWGAGVGYGLAATEILRICDLWGEVTKTVNMLQMRIDAVYGQLADIGAELAGVLDEFPQPPSRPYSAPEARDGGSGHG